MPFTRILALLTILWIASTIYGQTDFRPAYIIDLNNDTIHGQIDNGEEVSNSKFCHFRISEEAEVVEYLPEAISAYHFIDGKYYVSESIDLDGNQELVFVECLVKGSASLFYMRNDEVELYFIQKEGADLVALTNEYREVQIDGNVTKVRSKNYIRMLKATLADCKEIQSSIDNAKLTHRSLKAITCKYNDCIGEGETCISYDHGSGVTFRIGPVIGYSLQHFSMKGNNIFGAFDFDNSHDLVVGFLMDLSFSKTDNKLSIQLEAELGKSDFHALYDEPAEGGPFTHYYYDVNFQSASLKFFLGPEYNFGRGKYSPSLGGGLMLHKYIKPDFRYEVETNTSGSISYEEWSGDPVDNLFIGLYLQAGVDMKLGSRMILSAGIKFGVATNNPTTVFGLDGSQQYGMGVRSILLPTTFRIGILF